MTYLFVTVFIWGFSFALAKKALQSFGPIELVFFRFLLAFCFSAAVCLVLPSRRKAFLAATTKTAFVLGVLEFAGTYVLYTWALLYLPSGIVAALTLMTPVITYALGLVARLEPFSWRAWAAVFISVLGASLTIPTTTSLGGSGGEVTKEVWKGLVLILLSNTAFAVGNLAILRSKQRGQWQGEATIWGFGWAAAFCAGGLLVLALIRGEISGFPTFQSLDPWLLPVYLGVVATGLGFFLWNLGTAHAGATRATLVGNFKAPLALVWGTLLFSEPFTLKIALGLTCLIVATRLLPASTAPDSNLRN